MAIHEIDFGHLRAAAPGVILVVVAVLALAVAVFDVIMPYDDLLLLGLP